MKSLDLKTLLLGGSLLAGSFACSTIGYAQETPIATDAAEEVIQLADEEEVKEDKKDEMIVTGSRIKRDTFSSISPLQVITAETSIKAGLIDPASILQQSESASGTQIDATFQGFVLDNGPGAQTLNLRGLDPSRTLVLINGRRVAPSGAEGAPVSASINTIPGSLVDRYDLLLDGASSVYGSDAVAGVANVILRKDFDGFEVGGNLATTEQGGNTDYTISANWGGNNDRGFIGVGAEYDYRDAVTLADRDFLSDCDTHVEIDENGQIRRRAIQDQVRFDVWYDGFQAAPSTQGPLGNCKTDGISGRVFEDSGTFGSFYRIGGTETNIGIPGYVDQNLGPVPIDANGDGQQDYGFNEFSRNGTTLDRTIISEQKRVSLMAYGEYVLEGEMNVTPFFEALYTDTRVKGDSGQGLIVIDVGANNPFNPCGVGQPDCATGEGVIAADPAFAGRWNTYYRDRDPNRDGDNRDARICATLGVPTNPDGTYDFTNPGFFDNANCSPAAFGRSGADVGPRISTPIVGIDGDRDKFSTTQKNLRLVGGFKGDLPQLSFGSLSNWSFEASLTHSRSVGNSVREGVLDAQLNFALGTDVNTGDPTGAAPCTLAPGQVVPQSVQDGCVPVNLFADSLLIPTVGTLATQAERDYIFGERTFETIYEQTVWSGFVTGNLMDLPAGSLRAVIGAEYRIDDLDSIPNDVAAEGLFRNFFVDRGAVGKKATRELYAELDIPIVADKPLFRSLEANVSGRLTDDEFYGTNYTYSLKAGWRPVDSLQLKGSFGTSFRAPNLRENFLLGQSGFLTLFDPCVVPPNARSTGIGGTTETYDPATDTREADVLTRCIAEGIDPTALGLNTNNTGLNGVEIGRAGSLDLDPETSESYTFGFSFEQPFFDSFDLNIGVNYYKIEVTDSIVQPSSQFIINDCFSNPRASGTRSVFCDRVSRDNSGAGFITDIDGGFLNIASDLVSGFDFNALFNKEFVAFDRPMEFGINVRANKLENRDFSTFDDVGALQTDELAGEFGFPEWTGRAIFDLTVDDKWNASWTTRYIDSMEQDPVGLDDFSNVLGTDTTGNGFADTFSDTCGGAFVGDVNCRDVGFADAYWVHSASVGYRADTWRITAGVSNIFNTEPPEVDGSEVFSISNVPIGNGYDLFGRRFFVNARKSF